MLLISVPASEIVVVVCVCVCVCHGKGTEGIENEYSEKGSLKHK